MNNILVNQEYNFFFKDRQRVLDTKSFSLINEFGLKTFNTGTMFSLPRGYFEGMSQRDDHLDSVPQNNMEVIVNNTKQWTR